MASISIKELRDLQAKLVKAIDTFEAAPAETEPTIHGIASYIVKRTQRASDDFYTLAMQPAQNLAIRIGVDLDVFNIIGKRTPLSEIAQKTGANSQLLHRILRMLVATDILLEPEPKVFSATPLSRQLCVPSIRDFQRASFDTLIPIYMTIPGWLRKNGHKEDIISLEHNPTKSLHGANLWEDMATQPEQEGYFASAMSLQETLPEDMYPQYPWKQVKLGKESDVFIVDVAGGKGQYLTRILNRHPDLPGRKIIQDIPTVIASVSETDLFETQAHDFFAPNPIKGAKIYHLRQILHDWPDSACLSILEYLHCSMKAGYSKLLIQTYLIPEMNIGLREATLDLNMWTCCGMQRTKGQFGELLNKAGFKVEKMYRAVVGPMSFIEAAPA